MPSMFVRFARLKRDTDSVIANSAERFLDIEVSEATAGAISVLGPGGKIIDLRPADSLIGREPNCEKPLNSAEAECSLLSLTGAGGAGKPG